MCRVACLTPYAESHHRLFFPVAVAGVNQTAVLFTMPVAERLHRKKATATGFFTLAASPWRMIIGYARVSTTEQNLGLGHDDLKPAFDGSVDQTEARKGTTRTDAREFGRASH